MSSVCHEFLVEKLEVKPQKHPIKKKKSGGGTGEGDGGDGDRTRHEKKKEKKRKKERYKRHMKCMASSDLQICSGLKGSLPEPPQNCACSSWLHEADTTLQTLGGHTAWGNTSAKECWIYGKTPASHT